MTTYEITGNVTAGGSVQAKVGVGGGGGGGGAVNSVNGKTGDVVLTASDVGALPDTTPIPAAYDDTALKARVGAVEEDVSELKENLATLDSRTDALESALIGLDSALTGLEGAIGL